jgi:hypothetical protein
MVGMVDTMVPRLLREWRNLSACLILIPTTRSYFLSQNAAIAAGTISAITLNLKVLGIGDGLTVRHSPSLKFKLYS